jgi:phosphatidylethanolamine/phosphatidyl-N-methylethanolamine N-methyltransferase
MRRVCRPGGRIIILNHFRSRNTLGAFMERVICPLTLHIGSPLTWIFPPFSRRQLRPISIER